MRVRLWGTRGSVGSAGLDTTEYGGDTSAVEVEGAGGSLLVLDAGSGLRRLGLAVAGARRVDVLLTHLHMDHIQGLGFFAPLLDPNVETHLWGPASVTQSLHARLSRYLSPPLFPILLRDLPVEVHEVSAERFEIGEFSVQADFVSHPGSTLGYRIETDSAMLAYLPDHEPALGVRHFPERPEWTSGYELAAGADLLIHDAQYTEAEYAERVGWGHSTIGQAIAFAGLAGVGRLVTFHHDPGHSDQFLSELASEVSALEHLPFDFSPGTEGATFEL